MATGALALFTIMQGVESNKAAQDESKSLNRQGGLAVREAERDARITEEEAQERKALQKLSFLKSGVRLEGTPLAVLAETQKRGGRRSSFDPRCRSRQRKIGSRQVKHPKT